MGRQEFQIESLEFLSAHADYQELVDWLRKIPVAPKRCFITHGEAAAAANLKLELQNQLGWQASVPSFGESVSL